MTGVRLTWVKIRYRTKRGAKQHVVVADVLNNVERTVTDLTEHGCHSFTTEEV